MHGAAMPETPGELLKRRRAQAAARPPARFDTSEQVPAHSHLEAALQADSKLACDRLR